ncbi:MAG TPA: hypothetical protein VL400_10080 [Polyangiaceae bacterium]|nr:hypothetical protein [Polyangiaceae bacterium]
MKKLSEIGRIALVGCLGLALAACGDKAASKKSASDDETSGKSKGSAAVAAHPPKDVDAKVTAALDKLAGCKREEDRMADCADDEAWKTFRESYVENDDDAGSKRKKLALACLARVSHESPNVRAAAGDCVRDGSDSLADEASALELVLAQLEAETAADASNELAYAAAALDPMKRNAADRTLAVVEKMRGKKAAGWGELLGALASTKSPPDKAVEIAKEVLASGDGPVEDAIGLLENAKNHQADACKALLAKVQTGKYLWSRAMDGMGRLGCTSDMDAVVDFVVKKMGEEEGYQTGFIGADFVYLERVLDAVAMTKDQVAKLKKATEDEKAKAKKDQTKQDCDKVLAALAKE